MSSELLTNNRRAVGLRALPLYPVSEDKNQLGQTKNRPIEKLHNRQTGLLFLRQIVLRAINNSFL